MRPETRAAWLWGVMVRKKARLCRDWAVWRTYADRIAAHSRAQTGSPPWPDASLLRLETLEAVAWLVDQVHPSRREVADRYLFEDMTLEEIAEEHERGAGGGPRLGEACRCSANSGQRRSGATSFGDGAALSGSGDVRSRERRPDGRRSWRATVRMAPTNRTTPQDPSPVLMM